jgi:hypothetical protein
LSRTFHALNATDRVRTFEFLAYCRGMLLAFTRYGSERTRTVLEAADGIETQRRGAWRPDRIFNAWMAHRRRALGNESAEIEGNNPLLSLLELVKLNIYIGIILIE